MIRYSPGQRVVFIDPGAEDDEVSVGIVEETPEQYDGFYLIDTGNDLIPVMPEEICYSLDDSLK